MGFEPSASSTKDLAQTTEQTSPTKVELLKTVIIVLRNNLKLYIYQLSFWSQRNNVCLFSIVIEL